MTHTQAVAAGKRAAITRWGKKRKGAKKPKAKGGRSHARAVAAGKRAAITRWGPDGKKGTPKSRAKKKAKKK